MENTNSQAQSNHREIIIAALVFGLILFVAIILPIWLLTFVMPFTLSLIVLILFYKGGGDNSFYPDQSLFAIYDLQRIRVPLKKDDGGRD